MSTTPQETILLIGVKEAAKALGISDRTLWTFTQRGELPHVKIGSRVLYPLSDLQKWIDARKQGGEA